MFGIGTGELLLLLVISLLVLGPERMPKLARDVGKTVADLRKTSDELRTEFLNADKALREPGKILDAASKPPAAPKTEAPAPKTEALESKTEAPAPAGQAPATPAEPAAQPSAPPDAGATQAEVTTGGPDETAFDREAREARERLKDLD